GLPGGRPGVRRKTPARTFQGPLNPPARGRYGILISRSPTRLSRRDVVERKRIVMVEPRRTGMSMSSSGSHATPRWREMDSNLYGAFPVKRLFWVVLTVFCSERERPFFVPSPAIRSPEGTVKLVESRLGRSRVGRVNGRDEDA